MSCPRRPAGRSTRTISPFSKITVPEYNIEKQIEKRIDENTRESLDEAKRLATGNKELLKRITEAAGNLIPPQPASLLPRKEKAGVLFQCYAPDARVIYLAGDFNGWANNKNSAITDPQFAMQGPDANGVWRKVVKLAPGTYHFKLNLNGNNWFTPDAFAGRDSDDNGIFTVSAKGEVVIRQKSH